MRLRLHRPVLLATALSLVATPAAAEWSSSGDRRGEAGPGLDITKLEVMVEPTYAQVTVHLPSADIDIERRLTAALDLTGDGVAEHEMVVALPSGELSVSGAAPECVAFAAVAPTEVRVSLDETCLQAEVTEAWAQAWIAEAGASDPADQVPANPSGIQWMGPVLPGDEEQLGNARVTSSGPWIGELHSTDRAWDVTTRDEDRRDFDTGTVDIREVELGYDSRSLRTVVTLGSFAPGVARRYSVSLDTQQDGWTDVAITGVPDGRVFVIHVERDGGRMTGQKSVDCGGGSVDFEAMVLEVPVACLPDAVDAVGVKVGIATDGEGGDPVWSDVLPSGTNAYLGPLSPRPRPEPEARTTERSCPDEEVPPGQHSDTGSTVHQAAIDCVSWWGIAGGTGGDRYSPERTVNRAQMATFIAKALDRTQRGLPAGDGDRFSDDDGNPHEDSIDRLATAGIVNGSGDGTFGPGRPVTRAQMATFIVAAAEHALGRELRSDGDVFSDDDGNTHEHAIDVLASVGITGGSGTGYGPGQLVRRDQMASFLARLMDLMVEEGVASTP